MSGYKTGDKIYFKGNPGEVIRVTQDENEALLEVSLTQTRVTYLNPSQLDLYPFEDQLNENQKDLVIWMQENECSTDDPLESISDLFLESVPSEYFPDAPLSCVEAAYQSLTNQQKIEMAQEYLRRHLEQEEE